MDIFGIGGPELVFILIIMLVFAGPKRMLQWAYQLGKFAAKARQMWAESMGYLQKEFDEAGVGIELPKELPTKGSLNKTLTEQAGKLMSPVTKPVEDIMSETKSQLEDIRKNATIAPSGYKPGSKPATPKTEEPKPESAGATSNGASGSLGSWSSGQSDLGNWTNGGKGG
jgi:Sec-independent protein translocase protein TatA